ncbi:MAG: hypothetical protein FWC15_05340 [Fibromonadales bacterium]|nr:hypothetical protein [Fibromonadales bacterium]
MTVEASRKLYENINKCSDRASLEAALNDFSKEQRISLLLKIMGNPVVSYSCGYPGVNERYEVVAGAYLSGIWRRDYLSFKTGGRFI